MKSVIPLLLGCSLTIATASDKTEVTLTWENDSFLNAFGFEFKDRHYTQGLQLQAWLPDNETKETGAWGTLGSRKGWELFGEWGKAGMDVERTRGGWGIGQQLYTPEILAVGSGFVSLGPTGNQAQPDDHPYAGFLYLDAGWERRGIAQGLAARDRLILTVGIVGPAALGEETQRSFHSAFNGVDPQGWRFQLDNEVVVNLELERKWLWRVGPRAGWHLDLMPSIGLDLGTVRTSLNLQGEIRAGFGEFSQFVLPSMEPGRDWGVYAFAGARGRVVARDIFLDGNNFSDSLSVDREVLRGEITAGIGVRYEALEARVGWVRRSVEFEQQDIPNQYLSAAITWRY